MENPFAQIEGRLNNIESLLLEIRTKTTEEPKPENLTIDEVAEILKVSKQSVYAYIRKGFVKAKKIGRIYLISRADLDEATRETKSLRYQRAN